LLSLWLPLLSYCRKQKLLNGRQSANRLGKKSSSDTWMLQFWFHYIGTLNFMFTHMVMLAQNLIGKWNQLIAYASRLLNNVEWNYTTTKKEAFSMVYALHKFCHYLLSNKFIFCVDHMALLYLVRKHKFQGE
jgi:hypothetical protein